MTRRSALLLARLALAHDRTLTRSAAAESLWPEDYYDATRVRLRQELARLRKTLGAARDLIVIEGESIRLSAAMIVDVDEYRQALRGATDSRSPEEHGRLLEEALGISELPLMAGADEGWVQAERGQVVRARYQAFLELSTTRREAGQFGLALQLARQAISVAPDREEAKLLAAQSLADLGHPADAMLQLGRADGSSGDPRGSGSAAVDLTPKAVRPLRFSVPFPPEVIYGREKELAEIRKQLMPEPLKPRLITLLGPGGIGKSRLLLEAAAQIREMYGGRIAYADLSELHDARLVPLAILRTLRADSIPTDNPGERLSAIIPSEPLVFALDNLEQLGARMQVFVRRLLERHPELRIIVTSRGSLGIAGEHRIQLGPLPLPTVRRGGSDQAEGPALRMFVDLARANGVEIEADANARSIVRRLEGVPLAIILAAGRLRTLGADELDRQLEASFDVLSTGRPGVAERHRSMRRVVEGSFNSLGVDLQRVLCALAVFRGGWTLAAATRVCQLDDSLDAMEALLDASLIYVDQEGRHIRFRMLESIRSYALTQIDEYTLVAVRQSHADWISDLAGSVDVEYATEADVRRFDEVEVEWDNVRGALDYALDQDPGLAFRYGASLAFYWRYRSNGFEAFQYYEELFERYSDLAWTEDGARSGYGQVVIIQMMADGKRAAEQDRAVSLCRDANLISLCAKLEAIRASRDQNDQEYEACALRFASAEEFSKTASSESDRAFIAMNQGYCEYFQGRPTEAVALLQSAVDGLAKNGELFHQFRSRQLLAIAAMDALQLNVAEQALSGLLDGVRSARFLPMLAPTYNAEGKLAYWQNRLAEAIEWFTFSYEDWSERRVQWQSSEQEFWLGRTYLALGDLAQAESYLRRAAIHWSDFKSVTSVAMADFGIAKLLLLQGDVQEAADVLDMAGSFIRARGSRILASEWALHNSIAADLAGLKVVPREPNPLTLDSFVASCRAPGKLQISDPV